MTQKQMKAWIDKATYEQLMAKWRFAPSGDLFFQGELGEYYRAKLDEKRKLLSNIELVKISKQIGWNNVE